VRGQVADLPGSSTAGPSVVAPAARWSGCGWERSCRATRSSWSSPACRGQCWGRCSTSQPAGRGGGGDTDQTVAQGPGPGPAVQGASEYSGGSGCGCRAMVQANQSCRSRSIVSVPTAFPQVIAIPICCESCRGHRSRRIRTLGTANRCRSTTDRPPAARSALGPCWCWPLAVRGCRTARRTRCAGSEPFFHGVAQPGVEPVLAQ